MCKLLAVDRLDDLAAELGVDPELVRRIAERLRGPLDQARAANAERQARFRARRREQREQAGCSPRGPKPVTRYGPTDPETRNALLVMSSADAPETPKPVTRDGFSTEKPVTRYAASPSRAEVPGTPVPPVLSPETPELSGTQPSLRPVTSDAEAEAPARARGRRAAAPPPDAAAARGQATAVVEPPARLVAFDAELRQEATYVPTRRLYDLVERRYPELSADDLETEAYKMREWLHGPKGRGRRCDGRLILEWLKREARDRATRGGWSPPPSAARADTAPLARPPELHASPPAVDLVPDPAAAELWRRAPDKLATQMSVGNFSLYFRDTWGARLRDGAPAVGVERAYAVEPLQTRFDGLIRNVLTELTGAPGPVRVVHAHRSPVAAAQRLEA